MRRTDKVGDETNAVLHEIEEYMDEVELWFRNYEMSHPPVRRKIYLATDEAQVRRFVRWISYDDAPQKFRKNIAYKK